MKKQYDKFERVRHTKMRRLMDCKPASLTQDALREDLFLLETEIERLKSSLGEPSRGKLLVSGTHTEPKYYLRDDHGKRYLTASEMDLAATCAQREYYEDLLRVLEKRHTVMSNALKQLEALDPEKVFQTMSENRKRLVVPEFLPNDDFLKLWGSVQYAGKGFREGEKEYYTAKGERVRSKSETDIADRCYYRGVYYRYEYPWTLSTAGVWFPDFTVVNVRTRKVYIWEHLGIEDREDYASNNLGKLRIYQQNGFWPGENLILTHETASRPLTVRDIDAVIDHYLV